MTTVGGQGGLSGSRKYPISDICTELRQKAGISLMALSRYTLFEPSQNYLPLKLCPNTPLPAGTLHFLPAISYPAFHLPLLQLSRFAILVSPS
jgi:hypothetical protein